jgi:hypothetical protein
MTDLIHHNIMHFNDIKLLSLDGNIRLNTTKQNKLYINSDNSTLTINENCALGFGKISPNYGNSGDILVSNGELGTEWSDKLSTLNSDVQQIKIYISDLQSFFSNFKSNVFLSDENGNEINYDILINGSSKSLIYSTSLENDVSEIKSYIANLKLFFESFKNSIFISDETNQEINYSNIL